MNYHVPTREQKDKLKSLDQLTNKKGHHPCPVKDCLNICKVTSLMCPEHWCRVSAPTKAKVYSTWNNKTVESEYLLARREAINEAEKV